MSLSTPFNVSRTFLAIDAAQLKLSVVFVAVDRKVDFESEHCEVGSGCSVLERGQISGEGQPTRAERRQDQPERGSRLAGGRKGEGADNTTATTGQKAFKMALRKALKSEHTASFRCVVAT